MDCSCGHLSGENMLHSGIPGQKIGFTLFLPFAPPDFSMVIHFLPPSHLPRLSIYLGVR